MKNYTTRILLASAICMTSASMAQAGKLTIVNNIPDQRIQVCIRGKNATEHHTKFINAGSTRAYTITRSIVSDKPTFEVAASTGNGGDPDWKLLAGKCTDLVTDADHILLIDSTLGKTTCKNVTSENVIAEPMIASE